MAKMDLNTLKFFSTIPYSHTRREWAHWGHWIIYLKIKYHVRFGCHSMPYKKFTRLITRYLVQDMITWLNMFPSKYGISSDHRPSETILGSPIPDNNKLNITFGAYSKFYIDTTNSTKHKMKGAITLRTRNERGGYYFMYLSTRK